MSEKGSENNTWPLSWWTRQRRATREDLKNFDVETCESCRIIGGGSMIVAGCYIAIVGYKRAKKHGKRLGFLTPAIFASAMFSLGVMRLANYNPFNSSRRGTGIDGLEAFTDWISKGQTEAELWKKRTEKEQQSKNKQECTHKKEQDLKHMEVQEMQGAQDNKEGNIGISKQQYELR